MAERPLFIPQAQGPALVRAESVGFTWHSGFAVSQKRKSIASLHANAITAGHCRAPLEVSTKSPEPLGVTLSAFNLKALVDCSGREGTVEAVFQSSKVFERGGPFVELLFASPKDAKLDPRLQNSGPLLHFDWLGDSWALEPRTAFYDWIYLNALHRNPACAEQVQAFDAFTDIEFNPDRSINCQAYSLALYCALVQRGMLATALRSKREFLRIVGGQAERAVA